MSSGELTAIFNSAELKHNSKGEKSKIETRMKPFELNKN